MITQDIEKLVAYGLLTGLVEKEDKRYTTNRLLELFQIEEFEESDTHVTCRTDELETLLNRMVDYAYETGIITENSVVYRDLFDTKIMSMLVGRPSEIIRKFKELYAISPKKATDYYYKLSQDTDYIRRYRIAKDLKWDIDTIYGKMDITVNLSKPEKDPKAIAAAKNSKQSGYPKCLLCMENEGYAGRVNHPARQNHRVIPITIADSEWGFQYSPYVYYNDRRLINAVTH